jgi:hypothetical protein
MPKKEYALLRRGGEWMITPNIKSGDESVAKLGNVQFETPGSKVHQLTFAHNSLLEAAKVAAELQKDQTEFIERVLNVAMIVAYGRPFKPAEHPLKGEARRSQIEGTRAIKMDGELHKVLITLRDKNIAHTDLSQGSKNGLILTVKEKGEFALNTTKLLRADKAYYQRIESLCRRLAADIEAEIHEAVHQLGITANKLAPGHYRFEHDGLDVRLIRVETTATGA